MIDIVTGYVRIIPVRQARPDGSLALGGYSIIYDRDGKEMSRTQTTWNVVLTNFAECLPAEYKDALSERYP